MTGLNLLIQDSFFKEEVRWNYTVTPKAKEVWAVELDLLSEFDRVCRKYRLKYCAGAGTMLGAVRHGGFIPWDDDLDLYMLRQDFDELLTLANEFSEPYFLQTTINEKNLIRTFVRLRNTQTTGTTVREENMDICKGIFIDIFPLDGITDNRVADKYQYCINTFQKNVAGCFNYTHSLNSDHSFKGKVKYLCYTIIANVFAHNKIKLYRAMNNNLKKYSSARTLLWGNRTIVFKCPKSRRPLQDYEDLIYMPFEMLQIPVPRNYDSMLRQQYGDYMKIPENKKGSVHGALIVSTDYTYDDPRRLTVN